MYDVGCWYFHCRLCLSCAPTEYSDSVFDLAKPDSVHMSVPATAMGNVPFEYNAT